MKFLLTQLPKFSLQCFPKFEPSANQASSAFHNFQFRSFTELHDGLTIFDSRSINSIPKLANLGQLNDEINGMAKVYASEYRQAHFQQQQQQQQQQKPFTDFNLEANQFDECGPTQEQTFWIYKLMIMPGDMLTRLLSHGNDLSA